jgi:serine/threonine-protein kinase HipA
MPPQVAADAVRRFADALIWNWLIAGTDAHAKNYSLLLADNQVRLAPLYDIASALPYGVHEKKLRLAMKIGGDYGVFPHRNTWPAAAGDLGLDSDALVGRVRQQAALAPDVFAEAANAPDVAALDRDLPGRLVDLVADRASRCMQLIESPGAADRDLARAEPDH